MLKYLEDHNKSMCYGCRSCEQACPVDAIIMTNDSEGFLYPEINNDKCINCSACEKSCPFMQESDYNQNSDFPLTYAVMNKNDEILKASSSGGAFSVLADYVLSKHGAVAGCSFDENFNPVHVIISDNDALSPVRGSKYVQSDTNDTYKRVKKLLDDSIYVLYTGTPCQISGLKCFLKKDYKTLITVDLVCHGVPSNKLFHSYLSFLEKKYKGKIIDYKFRDKSRFGWISSGSYTVEKNQKKIKKFTLPTNDYFYHYYYLRGDIYRECCYECKYASTKREGDFTIADFWNVQKYHPEFFNKKGISLFVINNDKSKAIFEEINSKFAFVESKLEFAVKENGNLKKPSPRPEQRDEIYNRIINNSFEITAKQDCRLTHFIPAIKRKIPRTLKRKIMALIRRNGEKN